SGSDASDKEISSSDLDATPHVSRTGENNDSIVAPESPNVVPKQLVLLKDIDEDDEPHEVLRSIPDTDDLVRLYLKQIGRFPLLNAADEIEVAKRIEAGMLADHDLCLGRYSSRRERHDIEWVRADGRAAHEQMVSSNLRLVVSIAKRYTGRKMSLLDLIQDGNLGWARAVQKFDYSKGNKFSTYASWWIRQAIERGLADFANTIRIPVHLVEKFPEYWSCTRDSVALEACEHDHTKVEQALRMQPVSLEGLLDLQWDGHYAESQQSLDDRIATPEVFTEDPEVRVLDAEFRTRVNSAVD